MNETLVILENVNSFYSSSFDKLIVLALGMLTLIGVVLPILITIHQNRQLKIEKKQLQQYIDEAESNLVEMINSKLKEELSNEKEMIKKELDESVLEVKKEVAQVKGGAFFIQANNMKGNNGKIGALRSYLDAMDSFITAEDELNLNRVLNLIIDEVIVELNKNSIKDRPEVESKVMEVKDRIKKLNANGRYDDQVSKMIKLFNEAKDRDPDA